jgi:hypothetical protein
MNDIHIHSLSSSANTTPSSANTTMASSPFDAASYLYPEPVFTCNWTVEQCYVIDLAPQKCQCGGCSKFLHHICSIQWETKNNIPEGNIASLCRAHHPHYKKYVAAAAATATTVSKNNITGGVNLTPPVAAAGTIAAASAADTSDRSFPAPLSSTMLRSAAQCCHLQQ